MTQNEWVEYVEGWFKLVKTKLFPSHSRDSPLGDADSQQLVTKMLSDEENRKALSKSIPDKSVRLTTHNYDNISTITKRTDDMYPTINKNIESHITNVENQVKPIETPIGYGGSTKRRNTKRIAKRRNTKRRNTKRRNTKRR